MLGVVPTTGVDVRAEPPILADIATAQELLGARRANQPHRPGADGSSGARARCRATRRTAILDPDRDRAQHVPRADDRVPHQPDRARTAGTRRRHVFDLRHDGVRDSAAHADARNPADARRVARRKSCKRSFGKPPAIAAVATALGLLLGHAARDRARRPRAPDDRRLVVQRCRRRRRSVAMDLRARRSARVRRDADRGRKTGAGRRAHRTRRRAASSSARAPRAFRGATSRPTPPCRCSRPAVCCSRSVRVEIYAAFAGLFGVLAAGALLTPLDDGFSDERARPHAGPPSWNRGHVRGSRRQRIAEPHRASRRRRSQSPLPPSTASG